MTAIIIPFPLPRSTLDQDLIAIDQAYVNGEINADFADKEERAARVRHSVLVLLRHRWGIERVRRHMGLIQRATRNVEVEY